MCVIRLGTCGTPRKEVPLGAVVVADSSVCVTSNFDAFLDTEDQDEISESQDSPQESPYHISKPVKGNPKVFKALCSCLESKTDDITVVKAMDVTGDSFFSSQGRRDDNFEDKNSTLLDDIMQTYPNAGSLQMETFQLFHLARLSKGSIQAGACAIVLAQRRSNDFLDLQKKHVIEKISGSACLETLAHKWEVNESELMNDDACVWNKNK